MLLLIAATQMLSTVVCAQGAAVEARVASVSGRVLVSGPARPTLALARGRSLAPGDEIDTRGGGRLVIELSDGSQVIVQPGSLVVLKDYASASSLRELLEVLVGRVRVKVNHFGGRPNPYRVNSPTASIAVRGTEFSVAVEASGDTQVVVYEGLVEVASFTDPLRPVLVEPGHGAIIRPDGDIRLFVPGPNGERVEQDDRNQSKNQNAKVAPRNRRGPSSSRFGHGAHDNQQPSMNQNVRGGFGGGRNQAATGNAAEAYERYLDSIIAPATLPFVSRFAAFPDAHLDSLENPSYATEFTTAEGRLLFLPSLSGPQGEAGSSALFGLGSARPVDYGLSPQASLFVPLPQLRAVVGGNFAMSRRGLQSFTLTEVKGVIPFPFDAKEERATADATTNTSFTGSLIAARRFGSDGRTSLGAGLDHFRGNSSFHNLTTQSERGRLMTREELDSGSHVERTRLTLGLTRDLTGAHKLGLFYRYGITEADDRDRSHTSNGKPLALDSTLSSGRSSEVGLWLRGPITPRLFYGVEGALLLANVDEQLHRTTIVDSHEQDRTRRATLGLGLGYALRRRTLLSFDLTGGLSPTNDWRYENATGHLLEAKRQSTRFWSAHAALQTDLWRGLFASASVLAVTQSLTTDLSLYPDRFGRRRTSDGLITSSGQTRDRSTGYYSHFGAGWRLTPNLLAEYVCSTDYGRTSPSHTLLLRYTFNLGGK